MKAVVTFGLFAVSLAASSSSFAATGAAHTSHARTSKKAGPAVVAKRRPIAASRDAVTKPSRADVPKKDVLRADDKSEGIPKSDKTEVAKSEKSELAPSDVAKSDKTEVAIVETKTRTSKVETTKSETRSPSAKLLNASTRTSTSTTTSTTKHLPSLPVKPPCLREPIAVLAHLNEEDKFALTRCDGSPAPAALEHLSVAGRPGSAPKPTNTMLELSKVRETNFAPGVRRMDPLLVERLQSVIDHFTKSNKAPRVVVISGYRPSSVGSYHASGRALDFRLEGVRNEELVSFCKTLPDTGCGYYPNSFFIHLDIRDPGTGHVTWVDASGPGERPRYVASWPPPAQPAQADRPIETTSDALAQLERMSKGEVPPFPIDEHPATPSHTTPAPADVPAGIAAPNSPVVHGQLEENQAEDE